MPVVNEYVLREVLKDLRDRYHEEWLSRKNELIESLSKIKDILLQNEELSNEEADRVKELIQSLPGDLKLFETSASRDYSQFINHELVKNLLKVARDVNDENFDEKLDEIARIMEKIKSSGSLAGFGISKCTSWMSIVNWKFFMPTWSRWSDESTFIAPFNAKLVEKVSLRRFWGGNWDIDGFKEFFRVVKRLKDEFGIEDMIEIAYYLSKYSRDTGQPPNNVGTSGKNDVDEENGNEELKEQIEKIGHVLKTKKQVILYGPPGTGKTYVAKKCVKHAIYSTLPKLSVLAKYGTEEQKTLESGEYVRFWIEKGQNPGKLDNLRVGDTAWIYNPSDKDEKRGLIGLAVCIEKESEFARFSPYLLSEQPIITKEELKIISPEYYKSKFSYSIYEFNIDELKKLREVLAKKNVKLNYEFVTFHPSYAYEEFIEGLRPVTENGQIKYEVEAGVFKRICREAYNASSTLLE